MSERDDDGFLSRWAKRKRDVQTGVLEDDEHAETTALEAEKNADVVPRPDTETPEDPDADPEIPEDLAGIDIDKLDYESDFTVFMKENVPEVLKRQALRQLWRSNPILANVDGLNDYDTDFTDAATVMKGMQSAYQVGKGYFTAEDEVETDADADAAVSEAGATDPDTVTADSESGTGSSDDRQDIAAGEDGEEAGDETRTARASPADGDGDIDPFEVDETEDV